METVNKDNANVLLEASNNIFHKVLLGMQAYSIEHPMNVSDAFVKVVLNDDDFIAAFKAEETLDGMQQVLFDKSKDIEDYVVEQSELFLDYWENVFVQVCKDIPEAANLDMDFETIEQMAISRDIYPTLDVTATMTAALKQLGIPTPFLIVWDAVRGL